MKHSVSDYDFNLPDGLIATHPAEPRDHSRLLVLDKKTGKIEHKHFYDIIDYLQAGDILVLNNSKVIPARLMAVKKETGGKVEVLLHKKLNRHSPEAEIVMGQTRSGDVWQCLVGGKVKENLHLSFRAPGEKSLKICTAKKSSSDSSLTFGMAKDINLSAVVLKNNHDGTWNVKFDKSGAALMKAIEKVGEMPLPPYILQQLKIKNEKLKNNEAKKSYQTVYADSHKAGSVAAPTAGLHFTPKLLRKIKNKGVKILEITLYVGMGTFAPVKVEDFTKHKMHAEWVEISSKVIEELSSRRRPGSGLVARDKTLDSGLRRNDMKNGDGTRSENCVVGRVIAVGTTSARSLEACWQKITASNPSLKRRGNLAPALRGDFKAWVDIFIYPGYEFKIVDAMITNFHLPKSTLLMLVSALAGKKNIDKAYREAIEKKYRFYSYGDAMFIK